MPRKKYTRQRAAQIEEKKQRAQHTTRHTRSSSPQLEAATHPILQLQKQVGNQAVQRIIANGQVADIQRGWLGEAWEGLKAAVGLGPDEEEALQKLQKGLETAEKVCEHSADAFDPKTKKMLEEAAGKFGGAAGAIDKTLSVKGHIDDVVEFADAVQAVNGVDPYQDPAAAAKAFDKLFVAAGKMGKKLPTGPWTAYFEWMTHAGNFFENMHKKLDPTERYKGTEYEQYMP